ncbi:cytochrome P450 [Xylaria sp. FL0933]|nr:cytochrome P450 [Xylaria sp. FL0933]
MDLTLLQSQITQWLLLLTLIVITLLYLVITSRASNLGHTHSLITAFPVVGRRSEWFSNIRIRIRSLWKTADWAAEGYVKFTKHDLPCLIMMLDRGPMLLLSLKQMKTLYKLPENRLDIFGTLQQQIQAQYTVRDERVVRDPYHRYPVPGQLTRKLNVFTLQMVTEIADGFNSTWGTETAWKEVQVWKACFRVITRATNAALCGASLCSNPEYLQCLDGQSTAFFAGGTLISITPGFLRPVTGYFVRLWCLSYSKRFARICGPYIGQRIQETKDGISSTESNSPKVSEPKNEILICYELKLNFGLQTDALQLIIDEAISRNDSAQLLTNLIADRILITNNVTLHGVTFTVQHLLLSLISSNPSLGYIETLREECQNALDNTGGSWNLEAVRSLKLLDSAIRESMRIAPFASIAMARTVVDPQGIEIGQADSAPVLLPTGTMVAVPVESIHYDNDIYPDPHEFNAFRFVVPQREINDGRTPRYTTSKPATAADDHFFGFGTSKNPCPGRFLAVHEIKLILAHILLNYELHHAEWNPRLPSILATKVPKLDATMRVRRRA